MSAKSADLREEFTVSLVQLARRWRWRLDKRLETLGLTQARWAVLLQISRIGEAPSQRQLAEFVGIEGATLVHILNSLQHQKLIERRPDPSDRRAKTVHLTARAHDLIADIQTIAHGLRIELTEGLSEQQLQDSIAVFHHIDSRLSRMAETEAVR
ncbi:MAG: MarR family transcriptional regulator [Minwuia sp.]|uniref:MarR family transcriptional regulator n=1 Tax=Minwuia sp. TaxID=2493630 RepID=UPI003A89E66F